MVRTYPKGEHPADEPVDPAAAPPELPLDRPPEGMTAEELEEVRADIAGLVEQAQAVRDQANLEVQAIELKIHALNARLAGRGYLYEKPAEEPVQPEG
jgi:hypothetical protein